VHPHDSFPRVLKQFRDNTERGEFLGVDFIDVASVQGGIAHWQPNSMVNLISEVSINQPIFTFPSEKRYVEENVLYAFLNVWSS
jgi:hypothetical protein